MGHLGVHKKGACADTIHKAGFSCKITRPCFLFGFICDESCFAHALLMTTGLEHCFDLHFSQADNQAFEP
jgi:hypothetical protein